MKYTADRLKAWAASAADIRGDDADIVEQLRAHAAALEREAKLHEMLWACRGEILEMLARGADSPKAREVEGAAFQLLLEYRADFQKESRDE